MRSRPTLLLAAAAALPLSACGRAPGDQAVYDAMPRLALSPVAELCAGRDDAPCQFVNAQVVAAAPDGRVAVADLMGELREFDREGRFVRAIGRRGGGPGEYRLLVAAGYDSAGRVAVLDQAGMRVQRFDAEGGVVGAATAPMVPGTMAAGVAGDRVALFVLPGAAAVGDTVEARLILVDPETGDAIEPPGIPEPALATGDGMSFAMPPLFSVPPDRRWAVGPDGAFHLADGERLRVVRRDAAGGPPRAVVDLAVAPRPVTAAELDAEAERMLAANAQLNQGVSPRLRQMLDEARRAAPRSHPLVSRLVILHDGTLVAREGAPPGADSVRWNAFTAEGEPVGHLILAAAARVEGGRLERLLVVEPGADDVPRIRWLAAR